MVSYFLKKIKFSLKIKLFYLFFNYGIHVCSMWAHVHMRTDTHRVQKKASESLKLELCAVVS